MEYIERDFKQAYIKMKERAQDLAEALKNAETALKQIDVICHTPSHGLESMRHFQRDFDNIRKLTALYK